MHSLLCSGVRPAPRPHHLGHFEGVNPRALSAVMVALLFAIVGCEEIKTSHPDEAADVNLDGYIDDLDTTIVHTCLALPDPSTDPTCALTDVNSDGVFDKHDLTSVKARVGIVVFEPEWPAFAPDSVHVTRDDVVLLYSRQLANIFRWSLADERPLKPISVGVNSRYVAYSTDNDKVYVAYGVGPITQIDASLPLDELEFSRLTSAPLGLATAGRIVFAVDSAGAWNSHYTFLPTGEQVTARDWNRRSRDYAWSATSERMYFFRDGTSPNDLHWEAIDPETGEIGDDGETPYHGDYLIAPPIRVSSDGAQVLLGSGDIYDGIDMTIRGSLAHAPIDGLWLEGGELLTLVGEGAQKTLLRHWSNELRLYNLQVYDGTPVRVLESGEGLAVVTSVAGRPIIHAYVPTDDADGDGVLNPDDAYPLDPAASLDSDGDGYPDAWNAGYDESDSVEGLLLDSFPFDSACQLPEHARPGQPDACDIANAIPPYVPDRVEIDVDGVIYLLSTRDNRIYRWSLDEGYHLNPIDVGVAPLQIAYSRAAHSLYVSYLSGAITKIDLSGESFDEAQFATTPQQNLALQTVDPFVFAVDPSGAWVSHYTFDSLGDEISAVEWNYWSRGFTWSPENGRLYFTRDDTSPNDLLWEEIDTTTGQIGIKRDSPYHGSYLIRHPVRVSQDGGQVILGSGDIYDADSLEILNSLPIDFTDGMWLTDGHFVSIRQTTDGNTRLEHWSAEQRLYNAQIYAGTPHRILQLNEAYVVITIVDGEPAFAPYVPTDDGDGDGVTNDLDAFPLDPAASADSDGDGYPDAWNAGYDAGDSTEGLELDAFPFDSACQLAGHALPGWPDICDIGNGIPSYVPDQVVIDESGVVYLLSTDNDRVYRWSFADEYHLNPIDVGDAPQHMAYSGSNDRLYLAYDSGQITQLDLTAATPTEAPFANTPQGTTGLQTAGPFVFAIDPSGAWNSHYTFDSSGNQISAVEWNRYSRSIEWSAANDRMYFFRDGTSPNDLHWEGIDPITGEISGSGETPYHGDYPMIPPIRVAPDAALIVLGSGDYFDGTSLAFVGSLPDRYTDLLWITDGLLSLRTDDIGGGSVVEQWSSDFTLYNTAPLLDEPLRLLAWNDRYLVVTLSGGQPAFGEYIPTDDGDGDGTPNVDDAFPLDPAASVDTDRDGYPDAWNAGATAEDSTSGLVLDAFPLDLACQLPEHGIGGVCDFTTVLPTIEGEAFCATDGVLPVERSGWFEMGATGDFVPLCGGWLIIGDTFDDAIVVQNVVNGRSGPRISLPAPPGDLELDEERALLYATLPSTNSVAEIDLLTWAVDTITLPATPESLAMGPDGGLLIAATSSYHSDLYWLAADAAEAVGGWRLEGRIIRYNAVRGELIAGVLGASPSALSRYALDTTTGPVLLQTRRDVGGNGQDLAVSRDGEHVAFAVGGGNGGYTIFDFVASDINQSRGAWPIGAYPRAAAFDRESASLLASNGTSVVHYDVQTKASLRSHSPPRCSYGSVYDVDYSRGSAYGIAKQTCDFRDDSTRYHWFRVD